MVGPPGNRFLFVNRTVRPIVSARSALAVLLWAHLLAILTLAASPRLHHWVHPDADDDDHDCAVVVFVHGGCGPTPTPVVVPAGVSTSHVPVRVELSPIWVAGVFVVNGTRFRRSIPPRQQPGVQATAR